MQNGIKKITMLYNQMKGKMQKKAEMKRFFFPPQFMWKQMLSLDHKADFCIVIYSPQDFKTSLPRNTEKYND